MSGTTDDDLPYAAFRRLVLNMTTGKLVFTLASSVQAEAVARELNNAFCDGRAYAIAQMGKTIPANALGGTKPLTANGGVA